MTRSLTSAIGRFAMPEGVDRRWLALGVITISSFMTILDTTVANVALPAVIKDFDSSVGQGQLVLTVYLLALAAIMPLSGYLGERLGMKRLYMMTVAAFTLSSALCALAWSMPSLVAFRALQGVGGGMIQPVGLAITFTLITPLERARFMVLLGLPMLLGPILGPTVGGYLVEYVSWRAIFLINLPIGLINLVLARWLLSETPVRKELRLDLKGFVLASMAFPLTLLGLSEGAESGWSSPVTLALLGVGGTALAAFVAVELRRKEPLLQLRLFSHPMFSAGIFLSFVSQICFFGSQFLLPLFLQNVQTLGAADVGLILLPSAILDFAAINISGRLYNSLGPKPLAVIGFFFLAFTALALSFIDRSTPPIAVAAIASLRGLGMGLGMMPVMTMTYNTVAQAEMSRATALQNVLMRIFGSASAALLTTVLIASLGWHGAPAGASLTSPGLPVHFLELSFRDAFLFMASIGAVGTALTFFLQDHVLEELRERESRGVTLNPEAS